MKAPITFYLGSLEISGSIDLPDDWSSQVPRDVLTAAEAADYTRCSPDTLARAAASGSLRAVKIGRRVLYRLADLRAWLDSHAQASNVTPMRRTR